MKKRDLSKVVIIITIITIVVLLYIKYFIVNKYINGFKDIKPINNKEEVEHIDSFKINEKYIVYGNSINDIDEDIDENSSETSENIDYNEKKKIEHNNSFLNNDTNNIIEKEEEFIENSNIDKEKSVQVFKTDKNKLVKEVSFKDKLTILSIVKNLSSNEYKELLNNIKRNDELNAAVDIFTLLKDNLSKEDYEELKEIAQPYLNIEVIEKNIK